MLAGRQLLALPMIFADKLALWLSAALLIVLWSLHSLGTPAEDTPIVSTLNVIGMLISIWWIIASKTILPLWILLRILDAVTGGPARRRGRVRATILR